MVVDEHDRPIGSASYNELHAKGLYHRIVYIMMEDENGNLLLQFRGPTVGTHPNCWDVSAAGHVDAGEDYSTAASRELHEELGLHSIKLQEIGYFKSNGRYKDRILNRFNKVYKAVIPRATRLFPEAAEIAQIKWFPRTEVARMIAEHPELVADGLISEFKRYYA